MSTLEAGAHDLIVFVDETGHEELEQPKFPVFGLGGCAVQRDLYESNISLPWITLKSKHFGNPSEELHACHAGRYSAEQKAAIGEFFETQRFFRFAVAIKDTTRFPAELFRFQVVSGILQERLRRIVALGEFERVTMVFESCQRTNHLTKKYFSSARFQNSRKVEIATKFSLQAKSARESGLEVADFIVNAVGGRARDRSQGKSGIRKDFQSVFKNLEKELVSFIELETVEFQQRPQILPDNLKDWTLHVSNIAAGKAADVANAAKAARRTRPPFAGIGVSRLAGSGDSG